MPNDLTPTERLALTIADLEARLELANERTFFVASQNAHLRAALINVIDNRSPTYVADAKRLLDLPQYPPSKEASK